METNLEKAKRLWKKHISVMGLRLPENNYAFKMMELAATPDYVNKTHYLKIGIKIIEFKNGKFGVRKNWFTWYGINGMFTWSGKRLIKKYCQGTKEEAQDLYNSIKMK